MLLTNYDRLRSLGISVEHADALEPVLDGLTCKQREAFYLWAMGVPESEIVCTCQISKGGLWRLTVKIRKIMKE